ncbi:Hypothetical protein D9617_21g097920 [Elsinoe fawcettii]|nr:Hypothetical protein D9617_21g097920 [Elsinoe fawcettii]
MYSAPHFSDDRENGKRVVCVCNDPRFPRDEQIADLNYNPCLYCIIRKEPCFCTFLRAEKIMKAVRDEPGFTFRCTQCEYHDRPCIQLPEELRKMAVEIAKLHWEDSPFWDIDRDKLAAWIAITFPNGEYAKYLHIHKAKTGSEKEDYDQTGLLWKDHADSANWEQNATEENDTE